MPTELVTVNLTRENEKEEWGFILTGGGRDKDVINVQRGFFL